MFVGYAAGGLPGALVALLGSILPPTVLMLGIVLIFQRLRSEAWVTKFMHGISPAIAVLLLLTAWKVFGELKGVRDWLTVGIGALSLVALLLIVHPALVVLSAGLAGVLILR
jgi:chromate transporter